MQLCGRGIPEDSSPGQANPSPKKQRVGNCGAAGHTGGRHLGCGRPGWRAGAGPGDCAGVGGPGSEVVVKKPREFETGGVSCSPRPGGA